MVNLSKGQKVNLKKESPELKRAMLGLGWDTRMDLDSFAFLVDESGKIKETVSFMQKKHTGIFLNGDNLTGGGDGDDECIFVDFSALPAWVTRISFCANIFMGNGIFGIGKKDFSMVKGAFIRLVNSDTQTEICRYNLTENGKGFNAFHFADLVKNQDGNWDFHAIGAPYNGSIEKVKNALS